MEKIVKKCIDKSRHVLFAFATTKMARECHVFYNSTDVNCDIAHSTFRISIDEEYSPVMNWSLIKYNHIVIDECGMVRDVHINHIFHSLESLPVSLPLVLLGDPLQQLPLTSAQSEKYFSQYMAIVQV